jgi:hypothetical protein
LATVTSNYTVLEENNLPEELRETSGLYCPDVSEAYTVNDSGNEPVIYNIDAMGRIIGKKVVATKNTDWEALTGDNQNYYVGDVGNNNGKRKFVQIHSIPKQDNNSETNITTLKIFYKNNSVEKNEYLNHDFDSEALVNIDDSLILFSKSWNTGTLLVYQLNKIETTQLVDNVGQIGGLPGIITGGDFDRRNNQFILVGYKLKGMGRFNPFIAILNRDFTLNRSFELKGYSQVEGGCVTPNGEFWFTQEGSFFSHHKLVKLKITQ